MMFRLMMMLMQVHIEIAAFDAAGFPARYRIIKALKAQAVQYRIKLFPAAAEVEQGCNGHVAGNSGRAFQIKLRVLRRVGLQGQHRDRVTREESE